MIGVEGELHKSIARTSWGHHGIWRIAAERRLSFHKCETLRICKPETRVFSAPSKRVPLPSRSFLTACKAILMPPLHGLGCSQLEKNCMMEVLHMCETLLHVSSSSLTDMART
eukprot:1604036-Amphidinium_carterae.1